MIRSIHGLLFTIPGVLVAPLADVRLSKTLGALPPVCGIALSVVAEIAGVFNAWFWTFHNSFNSFNSCSKTRGAPLRMPLLLMRQYARDKALQVTTWDASIPAFRLLVFSLFVRNLIAGLVPLLAVLRYEVVFIIPLVAVWAIVIVRFQSLPRALFGHFL